MPKIDPAAKTQQAAQNAAEMQREVPDIMPMLADIGSQADAAAGNPEFEAYMDALAQDENDLTDPVDPGRSHLRCQAAPAPAGGGAA